MDRKRYLMLLGRIIFVIGLVLTGAIARAAGTGTITLWIDVENPDGGVAVADDFAPTVGGQVVLAGVPTNVNAGEDIAINETLLAGYQFTGIIPYSPYAGLKCPTSLGGTVNLDDGESITCMIINDDIPAMLTVFTHVNNNNGGTLSASDFNLIMFGGSPSPDSFQGVEKGTLVSMRPDPDGYGFEPEEIPTPGYTRSFEGECFSTVEMGDSKTCTITYDDIAPTLTVIKNVVNDNGGTLTPEDFTINVTGTNVSTPSFRGSIEGTTVTLDAGAPYVVDEAANGYSKIIGESGCSGTLELSQTAICEITNNDIAPQLTVTKIVVNNNTGTKQIADFPIFIDETPVQGDQPVTLAIGTHAISETADPDYTATITGDCKTDGTITLASGDIKNCLITNDDIGPPPPPPVPVPVSSNGGGGGNGPVIGTFGVSAPAVLGAFVSAGPVGGSAGGRVLGASKFLFLKNLYRRLRHEDVTELQKRLRAENLFTYPTDTGYFGPITFAAVKAYQKSHGIVTSGFVGPLTRSELNK